jgi:hypothetical protein
MRENDALVMSGSFFDVVLVRTTGARYGSTSGEPVWLGPAVAAKKESEYGHEQTVTPPRNPILTVASIEQ